MTSGDPLSRRSFLAGMSAVGGGLTLALAIPFAPAEAGEAGEAAEVTAWLTIRPDDTVVIRIARAEMGQGILTGLAMLVAEELECDWTRVRGEFIAPEENMRRGRVWGDLSTGASRSIATSQLYLRKAGATAREMLIAAAAARWNVPAAQCHARNSVVTHAPSGRTVAFGTIAAAAAALPPPAEVKLKEPGAWKLIGKPVRRLDVPDKVTAQPIYAIDVRLPDMLYAAIAQCPVFGGTLKSVDESAIAAMPGVRRVVRMPDAVAVVADSWWRAKRALEALPVSWDDRGNGRMSSADIAEKVRGGLAATDAKVGRSDGDFSAALAGAARRLEADYTVPFLAHATMEPQTCTAHVKPNGVEVWVPTQDATTALVTAALAAGVSNDKVVVHRTMLGGGFGRRGTIQEFVRQAIMIAKEVPQPVKLVWSREEDTKHDFYRPFGMARLTAGLDADGLPVALRIRLAGPSFVAGIVASFGKNVIDRSYLERAAGGNALRRAELSGRLRGAADAGPARRLARDQLHAECVLQGMLHRRDGACRGQRSLSLPAPAAARQSEKPRRARRRGASRPAGTGRRRRASIAASRSTKPAAATARKWWKSRWRTGRCACIASSRRSIPAMSSIRCRSRCRPKAPSSMR